MASNLSFTAPFPASSMPHSANDRRVLLAGGGGKHVERCVPSRRDGNTTTTPPTDIQRNPRPEHPHPHKTTKSPTTPPLQKKCPKIAAHASRAHPPRRTPTSTKTPPSRAAPQPRFNTPRSDPKITHFKKPKVPTHALFLTVCNTLQVSHSRAGMLQPRLDYQPALPCCVWCALLCFARRPHQHGSLRPCLVKPFLPASQPAGKQNTFLHSPPTTNKLRIHM